MCERSPRTDLVPLWLAVRVVDRLSVMPDGGRQNRYTRLGSFRRPTRRSADVRSLFVCTAPDGGRAPVGGLVSSDRARQHPRPLYPCSPLHRFPPSPPEPHPPPPSPRFFGLDAYPSHPPVHDFDENPARSRRHTFCTTEWRRSAYLCSRLRTFAANSAGAFGSFRDCDYAAYCGRPRTAALLLPA